MMNIILLSDLFSSEDLQLIGGLIGLYILIAILALLYAFFVRIYIAYRMAKNRHRDPLLWVLISFFLSPVFTWIALLILGDDEQAKEQK